MSETDPHLRPTQAKVLAAIQAKGERLGAVEPGLDNELRDRLEDGLSSLAGALARPVFLNKHTLGQLLSCEAHYLAEAAEDFAWTRPLAKGKIAHKAIQLSVNRKDTPPPLVLVDDAISLVIDEAGGERDVGHFLARLSTSEMADLRGEVNDIVAKFDEHWPPLRPAWKPRTESKMTTKLCDDKIVLSGQVDLSLGTPEGLVPGRMIADFKTGTMYGAHRDDLRFYALIDTLITGVPPFALVSYYLDSATLDRELVTFDILEVAVRRTIDGATRALQLELGLRSASVTPNPKCHWCCIRKTCEGAVRWAERDDDSDG